MEAKNQLKEALDKLNLKISKFEETLKEKSKSMTEKEALDAFEEKASVYKDSQNDYNRMANELYETLKSHRLVKVIRIHDGDLTRDARDNVNHKVLGIFNVSLCVRYDLSGYAAVYEDILKYSDEDLVDLVEKNMQVEKVNQEKYGKIIEAFEEQIKVYKEEKRKIFFLNLKKKKELDEAIDHRRKSIEYYQKLIDTEETPEYSPEVFKEIKEIQEEVRKALEYQKKISHAQEENSKAYGQVVKARAIDTAIEAAKKSILTAMRVVCGYDKGLASIQKLVDDENTNPIVKEIAKKVVRESTKKETR